MNILFVITTLYYVSVLPGMFNSGSNNAYKYISYASSSLLYRGMLVSILQSPFIRFREVISYTDPLKSRTSVQLEVVMNLSVLMCMSVIRVVMTMK